MTETPVYVNGERATWDPSKKVWWTKQGAITLTQIHSIVARRTAVTQ